MRTSISIWVWSLLLMFILGLGANTYLELANSHKEIQACYESNVVHMVDSGKSILNYYQQKVERGELSEQEAKARALEAISAIRYDNGNYIFMGNAEGVSISNGIKELEGTNIMGMQDPTGLPLVRHLYEAAAAGGGFVHYQWPDSVNKSELLPKTSYADLFEPWQWTLGTGLNMEMLQQDFLRTRDTSLINLTLVVISVGVVIFFFVRQLISQMSTVVQAMSRLAKGEYDLSFRLKAKGSKEMIELANGYNQLAETLQNVAERVHADGERVRRVAQSVDIHHQSFEFPDRPAESIQGLLNAIEQIADQNEQLQQAHINLRQLAEKDSLTSLLSTPAFEQQVTTELQQLSDNVPHSFYLLAFDQGQELSTQSGDLLSERLKAVAAELKQLLPQQMRICRSGDTSFMFWGTHTDFSEGMKLAVKVHQTLQQMMQDTSMSLGISSVIGESKRYELMHSEAERALLRAQADGGSKVYEY